MNLVSGTLFDLIPSWFWNHHINKMKVEAIFWDNISLSIHLLCINKTNWYQPSGTGSVRLPPAMPNRLQHLPICLIQNGKRGLEIGQTLGYWTLRSTFAKQVFFICSFLLWEPQQSKMADRGTQNGWWGLKGVYLKIFWSSRQILLNKFFDMRKEDDGEKERKERKKMLFIVATKVVASQPPEHRPTGMPTARAKN